MRIAERARGLWMLLRRGKAENELREEMRLHRELRERELQGNGATVREARASTTRRFGSETLWRERARDAWGWRWLEDFGNDLRIAARALRKSPGFALVATITLGIGIGANTALFSVIDAVLLKAAPFPNADRMISVHVSTLLFPNFRLGLSWPAFEAVRTQAGAVEKAAAYSSSEKTWIANGEPSLLSATGVTEAFFEQFGSQAQLGRLLVDGDQEPGRDHVAVISDALWRTRFGASPQAVGQRMILDDESYTIVGVAPPQFSYPEKTQVWTPLALPAAARAQPIFFMLDVIATLRRGERMERAQEQLQAIASQLAKETPDLGTGFALPATPIREEEMPRSKRGYFVLQGGALFVLLIACANLSSMLLARGLERRREMAVRSALGASRWRLVREALAESGLISMLGCAAGMCVARGGVAIFQAIAPADTPRLSQIAIHAAVLWFAVGVSLAAGIALGLVPALRAARTAPNETIRQSTGPNALARDYGKRLKFGGGLVVMEVALAFVLLSGSLLLTRTLAHALQESPGFRTDHLLTFDLPAPRQIQAQSDEAQARRNAARAKAILARVASVPGVEGVAITSHPLLTGMMSMSSNLQVEGALPARSEERSAYLRAVSPGYFQMMGIPVLRGREFTERDSEGSSAIIVNESMARQYWDTLDVIGRRISTSLDKKKQPQWREVIGVVQDTRDVRVVDRPVAEYFVPILQSSSGGSVLVRTRLEPQTLAKTVSRAIWDEFPRQPVTRVMTMTQTIAESLGDKRMSAVLLDAFAGIGLLLALVGIYGVIAFTVARRKQEVGIRMAVGAQPRQILGMILRQGMLPIAVGTVLGIAGALALGRLLASQLYGVKASDPLTFAGAALLLGVVAALACYLPAKRAMRVDPVVALRYE